MKFSLKESPLFLDNFFLLPVSSLCPSVHQVLVEPIFVGLVRLQFQLHHFCLLGRHSHVAEKSFIDHTHGLASRFELHVLLGVAQVGTILDRLDSLPAFRHLGGGDTE
jgi:hypothetical protein